MKNQDPPRENLQPIVSLFNNGKLKQALSESNQMLEKFPNSVFLFNISGASNAGLMQYDAAINSYKKALKIMPNYAEAYFNMGIALKNKGDLEAAIDSYKMALKIKPDYVDVFYNMGNTLKEKGDLEASITSFKMTLKIKPDHTDAYYNMGIAQNEKGDLEAAIASFKMTLKIKPDHADAYYNMGNALKDKGYLEAAIDCYKMTLKIMPDSSDAYFKIGIALNKKGDFEAALDSYKMALKIKPDHTDAYYNMGIALKRKGDFEAALDSYQKALKIKPFYAPALSQTHYLATIMSDWALAKALEKNLSSDQLEGNLSVYGLLSLEDNPTMHLKRATKLVKSKYNYLPLFHIRPPIKSNRIKVGYFSSYFRQHPVTMLSVNMLEYSDKEKFETFAFHYGPNIQDDYRLRIGSAFDHFIDVSDMLDKEIADLALKKEIDIAIEFNGFMKDERIGILAHHPAPIQINYLAYPGTMGANFHDYIVADETLIPEDQKSNYSENIIYLPNCYMPQDRTRQISDKSITRQEYNLPEDSFVFCCFNNSFKITPKEFDIWMRLLSKIDGSVLWLLKANKSSEVNLKTEAKKRGIEPNRLIFADKMPVEEHLARQKLADLFLDTFNFNAHTTASDALWVGLPVLTKIGKGFAARVASSLLTSLEVPELITTSEKEYEALALSLAMNPEKLSLIKKKLADKRTSAPLFDTETYTKNLEKAYTQVYERYTQGLSPTEIKIS
jgi:protein O-GlcNAc transferase